MAPFTVMSFRSMKKMAALRPQVERIMAEHKNDPKRANQEMFSLYRQHRVSPVGGCLPMLLQFPILIALFSAIPNFIDLRGQPFLWIADLSGPDRLALLPMTLPVIGNALNLLPILMAGAMYLQMKLSQRQMPQDQSNPIAKVMSGPMMSVIFGVMFYHAPSGLMLYWLTNSLISATWYQLAR
jgi:YidC/Oxa1 family membrane protein insertase